MTVYERQKAPTPPPETLAKVDQATLLAQALLMPGNLGDTYSRFTNYSLGNTILLFMQGVTEPVAGYRRWQSMNRYVKKGAKGKFISHPLIVTVTEEGGEKRQQLKGFKLKPSVFTLSDTEGEELPPVEPRTWDKVKALGALGISEVPFESSDGNMQGYSMGRNVAINPIAKYPFKTLTHEIGHVVLGHTAPDQAAEYQAHRGTKEFQAEAVAYLTMHELGLEEHMNVGESRAYINHWLGDEMPADNDIRPVFMAVDRILKAGRIEPAGGEA